MRIAVDSSVLLDVLTADPHTCPNQTKKSPVPLYHAATKAAREAFWDAYSAAPDARGIVTTRTGDDLLYPSRPYCMRGARAG